MTQAPQASHAPTHMTNQGINRAPLPALLAGLFILAGCGGSALPIPVIATESTDVANNLETRTPDSIFLSVNEQPPVDTVKSADSTTTPPPNTPIVQAQKPKPKPKQEEEQEQEQKQAPPPVFAVAPPQERSFSQSQPEPQTSTETVIKKIDTTASQTVARTEDIVFTDWTGSFTSPALPATATFTGNGFLSGAIDFDATGADRILNSGRLNLATATFYGDAIGGDADDGVAFFRAEKNGQTHNYAGLSSDTDLGAPLVEEADKTATWNGHFRSVGYLALDTDFTLTVDFSAARTLTATTTNIINNHFFTLTDATYDENGVIIGGITITNGADSGDGVLTGLIGQDGAVGAFYSNARGAKGYVGGFVASPTLANNPDINFADWALSFTNPALATTADFTDNGFLAGAAVELEHTDASSIFMNADKIINAGRLNLSTTTFDGNAIGEDADDGVIFFRAEKDSQTYNYAGVLTGTNLGAPLVVEAAKTAEWTGHFYALVGDVAIDTDFTLTVDFSTARTLEARTYGKSNNYFTLENATYNENGVISGMVRNTRGANTADGVLTGLIGDDGAVGAFYSNDRGANSYAGGFVASKTVKTYNTDVTASDWTRSFSKVPPNQVTSSTRRNEFLSGGLLGGRLDETGAGTIMHRGSLNLATATYDGVRLGGDAGDGMSFFRANNNGTVYNYAGLYSSTDLGAPLGDTFRGETTANWGGRIRTAGWFNFDTDFILKVNFGTRKLNVDRLRNPADTDQWLEITDASYTTEGVISGRILIDEDNDPQGIFEQYGFLTGLIGQEGAVASFISTGDNVNGATTTTGSKEDITRTSIYDHVGGFVARPTAVADPNITIDDWTDTANFTNALQRNVKRRAKEQTLPVNAFLLRDDPAKRPSWKKPDGGGSLSLSALGGDATDGVDFFPADIKIVTRTRTGYRTPEQRNYYAGLWDSTNLGAAIPLSTNFNNEPSAMWHGKFSVFQGANARFDTDFMLTVDFVNNSFSATVEAGAEDYYMNGSYMANGFLEGGMSRTADGSIRNGIISGLIGSEGVVAAFVSSDNGDNRNAIAGGTDIISTYTEDGRTKNTAVVSMFEGYAGGFVASPNPPPPAVVDASDIKYTYTRNFVHIEKPFKKEEIGEDETRDEIRTENERSSDINYADIPTTVAGLADTPNPNSRFLRIEGLNIDSRGLTNPTIHTRRLDYTAGSAGFGDGYVIISSHGYAALLPTTDLGAARPVGAGQPTVRWFGMYSLSGNGAFAPNTPIDFDINFAEGTLTGTAQLANSRIGDNITINTTFGADGVMSGTFSTDKVFKKLHGDVHTIDQVNTNVIGLIGTEGLVGIMHGNIIVGTTVTGGFVARSRQ